MTENIFLVIFPAMMIFAAITDLLTFTIPNGVPATLCLGYFLVAVYFQFPADQIAQDMLCGFVVLLVCVAFFSLELIGGGDAKLAAATAFWLGWENILSYGVVASLAGFVLTVLIVYIRFRDVPPRLRSVRFLERLADKKAGVPYGVALALGGLLVYPQTSIWTFMSAGGA